MLLENALLNCALSCCVYVAEMYLNFDHILLHALQSYHCLLDFRCLLISYSLLKVSIKNIIIYDEQTESFESRNH